MANMLKTISKVEPHEIKATVTSFLLVLILMAAYYILRPVRDAMASDWSDAEVATLWTINFFFSFVVVAAYGTAISKISLKNLVPGVYGFFAATFVLFYFASSFVSDTALIDKAFYIWVSVFSLFPVSVFWSFMADIYTKDQSKRLFGIITTGASIGAMIGPSIPLLFSDLGTYNLMLVACVVLMATLPIIYFLQSIKTSELGNADHTAEMRSMGGNSLDGFSLFLKNPFLLGIGLFLFLYTGIGSFIYLELKNLMADMSRAERTEIWAFMDLATNTLTIVAGLFITSRLATKVGLGWTLALLPIVVMGGLLTVAMVPLLSVVVGLQIFRRGGNYAITRPAREMLFTHVDQETRFKAKPVIDVVVYRGGDTFWGWAFAGLTQGIGLGMVGVAIVGAGIAALWSAIGLYLGKKTEQENN
ncbi:MFS transporter [Oceanicoccus sagamiensis]|uniref:MFS transporter n=2 Tax=Oceanicoccus sagamiensis TaxID=716816 RepID=A0A1X9NHE1_9GAMM|nr:MFS transporter [Oceanicoccus sagamiensis]